MKKTLLIKFIGILCIALFYQPTFASGDTIRFDFDGNVIEKAQYELIASALEKTLSMKLSDGYNLQSDVLKDPIKLRKKRIEQWRIMRSNYHPDSLPKNIEKSSVKKQ